MKQLSKNTSTLLFILLTGVLIVVAFISYNKILQYHKSVSAVMHTNEVKTKIVEVVSNLKDAEIDKSGYLLTEDSVFLQPFIEQRSIHVFAALDSLLNDNPMQRENLKKLKTLVDEKYFILNSNLELLKNNYSNLLADSALLRGKIIMDEVKSQVALMIMEENKLLVERSRVKDRTATITPVFLLALSLFSALVIALFFFRLQKETSERISITESNLLLQKAMQQIEDSEVRFRTLSETIPHMVWTATPDGKKNFFNKYFLDYTGLTFEELKGDGWQKTIFPEDLKRELLEWNQALKTGEDFKIEKRVRKHSGTFRWHLCHGIAQKDKEGTIIGWIGTNTEIEDQKRITEALAKGEEQFRTFANSIQNLAWIANGEGWIYWYNQRWLDYTGTTLEEMEGWGWQKVHHPDHVEKILELSKELWKKDEAFELTFPLRRYDGEYRWFLTRAFPVKDDNGNIERWIGTNTDITEQKSFTEELEIKVKERTAELEVRKNFVETILETSQEYIAVYANDFTFISINKATENLLGKKREDVLGKKFLEIFPLAQGSKAETDLQSAFNGNRIHNEVYKSSVTEQYIENDITPLKDRDGQVFAALAIANDVTNIILKQKEIEEANNLLQVQNQIFAFAENIVKLGTYTWNMTTGFLEYSDNLFRLFDCEPKEFVPNIEKFLTFIHPDDLQQVTSNGEQTMQTGVLVETPYRIISKNGTIKTFRSSGKFTGEGDNRMLIGAVQDISEDVAASNELKTKNLDLENANVELASFSYVASHDLQEPLRKIQGFSKRIIDKDGENLSVTTKDYFNRIIAAAQRMQNLIESLLSYSRTNLSEVIFVKTDLNQTLIEVQTVLKDLILQKKAVIESQTLPVINAVPIQMHQLFLNLIGNSLKYSKPAVAPHVKITAEEADIDEIAGRVNPNGPFWKIEISDNGIGFEQQYENKIFELFQRLHVKSEYEGTGIGLAICKKIVQTHNGTISATGRPGIGSTFSFFLSENNKS